MAKVDNNNNMYGHERYKFKGLGEYKLPIEKRVNEICEMTKKEFPEMDNYLLWVIAVDYVMFDEMKLEKDTEAGKELYDSFINERNNTTYNCVKLENI